FGEDFRFIAADNAEDTAQIVREIYLDEVKRAGIEQVQILTPYRVKTVNGANELNKSIEDLVNPQESGKKELYAEGKTCRAGDKILQNKNTEMASNGDLGKIMDFYTDEEGTVKTVIAFSDGREVTYEPEQMEMIEHANAITIHKAQGSECDIIIIPWVTAF